MADAPKAPPADVLGRKQTRTATLEFDKLATRAEGDDRMPVALSSDQPVDRWFGREILVHTKDAIDLSYAPGGALPFLDGHDTDRQIGAVEDVGLGEDGKLRGMLRMGNHPDAAWIFADIAAGIRKNISVGYRINELKLTESSDDGPDVYQATRWTPMEGSTVSIPADITVGVGRSDEAPATPNELVIPIRFEIDQDSKEAVQRAAEVLKQQVAPAASRAEVTLPADEAKERTVSDEKNTDGAAPAHKVGTVAVSLEDQRKAIADISRIAAAHDMTDQVPAWVERGLSVEQVKAEIFDAKIKHATRTTAPGYLDLSEKDAQQFSYTRAITNILTKKWVDDGGFEKEVSDAVAKRSNRQTGGFFIPLDLKVRAAATGNITSTSSLGGAGVQTTLLSLIDLLRNKMLVRQLGATVLSGLQGNISFPRQIVPNTMAWEGENPSTAHAATAATLDNVTLSPKTAMASSAYSRQLLIQSSFDVSSFIQNDLATVLALGLDLAALDGTGSANQPTGVMRQTGVTTITHGTTDGAAPDWASMVSYETNVAANNADIGTMAWVTSPAMRGKLKTVLKSTTAGSTYIWEQDQTINGYGAYASQQMPNNYTRGTSTTVASGIVFGVWSELLIGEWGGALEVIVDPYTLASQNMVAVTQMILADIAVRHPKAFAQSKSALSA